MLVYELPYVTGRVNDIPCSREDKVGSSKICPRRPCDETIASPLKNQRGSRLCCDVAFRTYYFLNVLWVTCRGQQRLRTNLLRTILETKTICYTSYNTLNAKIYKIHGLQNLFGGLLWEVNINWHSRFTRNSMPLLMCHFTILLKFV